MKCPHCGKEHSDGAKFCENTGKDLLKACPWEDCADYGKAILPMRAKFYPICGRPLQRTVEQVLSENHLNTSEPSDQTFMVKGVEFKMIKVEGGTFSMGATSEQEYDALSCEKPVHSVTLSDYYIGETEVTQELWEAVMGSNPSYFEGDNQRPVENVSWNDCQKFIKKLNRLTGKEFRLPTEAEWEYAARGGKYSRGYKYSGSNNADEVAWYHDNSGYETNPVKTKKANKLGLYDMSGNVYEWCNDWWGCYQSNSQTNPTGPSEGESRVLRGGGWCYFDMGVRVSRRDYLTPGYRHIIIGLRLAL
ncbi:MAG: SUMF1/EgtB/PvdO family nonheme iron enzyme [Candidatus Onthomorpha sp.]|nr:SUMF1/EgtB/PvdO family nonheme iron enzyme [Candidatus Onthomorpha sp.]